MIKFYSKNQNIFFKATKTNEGQNLLGTSDPVGMLIQRELKLLAMNGPEFYSFVVRSRQ